MSAGRLATCLLFSAASCLLLTASCLLPSFAQEPPAEPEPVQVLWERALPPVYALALAPDGSTVAALYDPRPAPVRKRRPALGIGRSSRELHADTAPSGALKLHVYDRSGALRWAREVEGAFRVVTSRGGELTAAYTPHSALFRTLRLWDRTGRPEGSWTFTDPIEAVALADSGDRVVAGTLAGELIVLRRQGTAWRRSGWRVGEPVHQIALGPNETLFVAAGDPPALMRYGVDGSLLWRAPLRGGTAEGSETVRTGERTEDGANSGAGPSPNSPGRPASLSVGANGQLVAVAGEGDRPGESAVQLWSASGRRLWRLSLQGRSPCLRLADSGEQLVLAYDRFLPAGHARNGSGATSSGRRRSHLHFERVLACFDRRGAERWSKGGAFFAPFLLGIEARGEWVLSLGRQSKFWLRDRTGETRWRAISPAPIRIAVGSRDGRSIAAYRTDGRLVYLAVSRERQL